jgi:two-component system sensor histidine kinase ChvG
MKLVLLAGILVALPLLLYAQFERADKTTRSLVSNTLQRQSWLIAQGLKPLLDAPGGMPADLNDILARYGGDGTELRLMLAPAGSNAGFLYVAAEPKQPPARLNGELAALNRNGVARQLAPRCADETATEIRNGLPGARDEMMTSIVPIQSRWGCWVLVSSHSASELFDTSVAEPYWKLPPVRLAILVYGAATLLGCFIAWNMLQAMRRFRRVANAVRQGRLYERSFSSQNDVPELAPVAADFDELVRDLHKAASDIRRKAEDNAHSLKTPLATIRAALSPLRHAMEGAGPRAKTAIDLIDSSVGRLNALISDAQMVDNFAADAMDRPQSAISLHDVLMAGVSEFQEIASARGLRFALHMEERTHVLANHEVLGVAVENVLDNAVSFSPDNGEIEIRLRAENASIELSITDDGPGVRGDDLSLIFDRYFSRRGQVAWDDQKEGPVHHSGLGLWIVRQNIEAIGGRISAANCRGRGLRISIVLPRHDADIG